MSFRDKAARIRNHNVAKKNEEIEAEIVELNQNDNDRIPPDVWKLMQDNGRIATERLNELLTSARFHRLKASDQAKLIALAQDRAYGKADPGLKRIHKQVSRSDGDAVSASLSKLTTRAQLPEYRRSRSETAEDAELVPEGGQGSQD